MRPTRRRLVAVGGAVALGGCSALRGGNPMGNTPTANPPEGLVANAPVPEQPSGHTYATMGSEGQVVTYFGSWKCPGCSEFSTGFLGDIVEEYVEPGKVRLRYRGLAYTGDGDPWQGPDNPRAARAGLAVWNVDPASYWPYHELVFAEQPPEGQQWATTDRLAEFAHIAGVDGVDAVREEIEQEEYERLLRANPTAAAEAGIEATPSIAFDGETVVPTEDEKGTRELLDRAAEG